MKNIIVETLSDEDLLDLKHFLIIRNKLYTEDKSTNVQYLMSMDKKIKKSLELLDITMASNGCCYNIEKFGFLPSLMKDIYEGRTMYKAKMLEAEQKYVDTKDPKFKQEATQFNSFQHALKILLNSAYGALGNKHFRWFDVNHAEAITLSGQLSIQWITKKLNLYLNKVCKTEDIDFICAGDTDSVYITLDKIVEMKFPDQSDKLKIVNWLDKFCQEVLEPFIDKSYQELADHMHAYGQFMKMKREAIADVGIWTGKKRYIINVWNNEGVSYKEPELVIKGIEAIRSSTPKSCRDAIKECIKLIVTTDEKTVRDYIKKFRTNFEQLEFEDIAFPRGVSRLTDYQGSGTQLYIKGTPIHAKGSILYNDLIKKNNLIGEYDTIGNGDKIRFCYLRNPNPYGFNVISCLNNLPKEFGLDNYLDYETQFEKAFLDPLDFILKAVGWSAVEVSTLENFF